MPYLIEHLFLKRDLEKTTENISYRNKFQKWIIINKNCNKLNEKCEKNLTNLITFKQKIGEISVSLFKTQKDEKIRLKGLKD